MKLAGKLLAENKKAAEIVKAVAARFSCGIKVDSVELFHNVYVIGNLKRRNIYWQKEDKKVLKRINLLIADAGKNPTGGTGNTEALKHNLSCLLYTSRCV